jgi:long-chain acyl-CoA synthetase
MTHIVPNADVMAGARRFARALDAAGVPKRAVVAVLMGNRPEYLHCYRGATESGRSFTPISWHWTADDVAYVLENSEAACVVADAAYADAARDAARRVPPEARFSVGGTIGGFRSWSEVEALPDAAYEAPLAGDIMLYTSGTTGRPKGVRRAALPDAPPPSHIAEAGAMMLRAFLGEDATGGTHLVAAPLYHAGPCTYCDGALLLGADVVLMERFDPERFLSIVEAHRVTSTFLVPIHFVRLLRLPEQTRRRYDLSSLRMVCHGAAPVSIEVKRAMIDWWGPVLFEFYGGTEGGGIMISSEDWLAHPGSVGRPRPGLEIEVRDDAGRRLPPGVEGTVYMSETSPFEYKGEPEKTADARSGDRITLGDIGYLDEDGYLYLCDRRADVVVSGGVNLYPAQIESAIQELPIVADCCVVGAPDEEWGEQVRAVVELEAGCALTEAEVASAVIEHCRKRLAGPQVPRGVDLHPGLPRTETGKLARRRIREPYWRGRARRL